MKLTKYKHSCFTLEKNGNAIVVDPGEWSTDFVVPEHVVAIVVTHEHADHFDESKIRSIIEANPEAMIFAPSDVTEKLSGLPVRAVSAQDSVDVGGYHLEFVGGIHATIHKDFHPQFTNVGVIIDDMLYHPGDSLFVPDQPIKLLSLPIMAPWEKVSESMDFLMAIKPDLAFPSHDALLSEAGIELFDRWHTLAAEKIGSRYIRVVGSIEI